MSRDRATIRDVAREAQVSRMTVTRAMSGNGSIRAQTRSRVIEAAHKLDYRPSALASGLRGGPTRTIAVLWPFEALGGDSRIATEVTSRISELGYVPYQCNYPAHLKATRDLLGELAGRSVEALLIGWRSRQFDDPGIRRRLEAFPAVVSVVPERIRGVGHDQVIHDRYQAIREVVDHLAASGRRRPMFMATMTDFRGRPGEFNQRKAEVFRQRCRDHGLTVDERTVLPTMDRRSGPVDRYGPSLAQACDGRTFDHDALLCLSDEGALASVRYLESRGLAVPDDVAVIGFNDTPFTSLSRPPLASVNRQHACAADLIESMLIDRLHGVEEPARHESVAMHFVWRESAGGPAPAAKASWPAGAGPRRARPSLSQPLPARQRGKAQAAVSHEQELNHPKKAVRTSTIRTCCANGSSL